MKSFRNFLIWIKKQQNTNKIRLFLVTGLIFAVFTAGAYLIDTFLPFDFLWNIARMAVMIVAGVALFIPSYAISIILHKLLQASEREWTPFRERWSPAWRRRIAAIVAAASFLLVYATTNEVGMTFASSIFFTLIIAMLAFIRTTSSEQKLAALGVPDYRDIETGARIEEVRKSRDAKTEQKRQEKESKRGFLKIAKSEQKPDDEK